MIVYLAASFRRQAEMRTIRRDLAIAGISCSSRWLDVDASMNPDLADCARDDLSDIRAADMLVCFTDTPEAGYLTGGKHVETGYAFAFGKPIVIVGDHENAFHHLPGILVISRWDAGSCPEALARWCQAVGAINKQPHPLQRR